MLHTVRVDRLGIKQDDALPAGSDIHELTLHECTTATSRHVITLVRCTRSEHAAAGLFATDA